MSKRRSTEKKRCPNCRIHQSLCFCEFLIPIETQTRVSIIMHHREEHLTSNTATLAEKILTNSHLFMRGLPESPFSTDDLQLNSIEETYFLYPHEDAILLNDIDRKSDKKFHLIIPDGSWSQARKVYRREKGLENIKCAKLPDGFLSEYKLRKTHIPDGLSTFEAIARAIGILESHEIENKMMDVFRTMVARVIKTRTTFHEK